MLPLEASAVLTSGCYPGMFTCKGWRGEPSLVVLNPPSLRGWGSAGQAPSACLAAAEAAEHAAGHGTLQHCWCLPGEEARVPSCDAAASSALPCIRQQALFWDLKLIGPSLSLHFCLQNVIFFRKSSFAITVNYT